MLDAGKLTSSELVPEHLSGAKLVKAFNNISDQHIPALTRPSGAADRTALIDRLGFDTVDAGTLAESWRFEPETDPFVAPYFADPVTLKATSVELGEQIRAGLPLTAMPPQDPGVPMGCSTGAVKSHTSRGLAKLRLALPSGTFEPTLPPSAEPIARNL